MSSGQRYCALSIHAMSSSVATGVTIGETRAISGIATHLVRAGITGRILTCSADSQARAGLNQRAVCASPASSAYGGRQSSSRRALSESIARLPVKRRDRKSTRLNSSHLVISYAVFCLKKKKKVTDDGTHV